MFWIISAIAVSTAVIVWQIHAACAYLNDELRREENDKSMAFLLLDPSHRMTEAEEEHKSVEDFHAWTH